MNRNILLGLSALALTLVGCVRFLNARNKRKEKPYTATNMDEDLILYGVKDGHAVSLNGDAERLSDGTIDVSYGSHCGNIKARELPEMQDGDVMELRIKTRIIGKECGYDR